MAVVAAATTTPMTTTHSPSTTRSAVKREATPRTARASVASRMRAEATLGAIHVTSATASPAAAVPTPIRHTARRRSRSATTAPAKSAMVSTAATSSTHRTRSPTRQRSSRSSTGAASINSELAWFSSASARPGLVTAAVLVSILSVSPISSVACPAWRDTAVRCASSTAERKIDRNAGVPTTSSTMGSRSERYDTRTEEPLLVSWSATSSARALRTVASSSTTTARAANSRLSNTLRSIQPATRAIGQGDRAQRDQDRAARPSGRVPGLVPRSRWAAGSNSYFGCIRMAPSSRTVSPFK